MSHYLSKEKVMEAAEHIGVGDAIRLRNLAGEEFEASDRQLPVGGHHLSYGQIIALGGDFYGRPASKAPGL